MNLSTPQPSSTAANPNDVTVTFSPRRLDNSSWRRGPRAEGYRAVVINDEVTLEAGHETG